MKTFSHMRSRKCRDGPRIASGLAPRRREWALSLRLLQASWCGREAAVAGRAVFRAWADVPK